MLKCKCEKTDALSKLSYLALFLAFAAEFFFFRSYVLDWVSPYYPANHDQAGYLEMAYSLHDALAHDGSLQAKIRRLAGWFFVPSPQGKLFPVLANVSFMLVGEASRYAALLPNLACFLILQFTVFYVLKKTCASRSAAFMGAGFLLALHYPFYWAGSLFDFRMDFMAFCVFGVWAALVAGSSAFASRRWVLLATLVGIILVLLRHVTMVYIGIIYLALLIFVVARAFISTCPRRREISLKRSLNIVLSGVGILIATAPVLYASRAAIIDYYLVRHFKGADKIRALEGMMAKGTLSYLMYYPNSVIEHLGPIVLAMLAGLALASIFFFLFVRRGGAKGAGESTAAHDFENFAFLFLSILVPLVIYTIDISKTPVVAGIVLPSTVLFSTLLLFRALADKGEAANTTAFLAAAVIFLVGFDGQISSYREPYYLSARHNNAAITEMYMDVGDMATKNKLAAPLIGYDRMADYFTDATITDVYYERGGGYLKIKMPVKSVEAIDLDEALKYFRSVDFAVFSPTNAGRGSYPFDQAMDEHRPELEKLLADEFVLIKRYGFNNKEFGLYWNSVKANSAL
jgi:hypothetical protein